MSNKDLKLALELAAKATGREEIAALNKEVGNLGPISSTVEQDTKALAQRLQQLGQQRDQIDAFNKSKEALTQLEQATVLSRDKLETLRQVQASGAGDAEKLAKQEQLLASEVKQLESQLVRQAATHTKLGAGLKQSGIDTRNLGTEQNRLQREITETASRTETLARELTDSKAAAASFAGSVGGVTKRLLALGAAYIGVDRLWESLKAMFSSGDQAERLSVQLKAVMGSIQGGKEATAWINKFATDTPLQLDEVTQLFVRLKAFGIDPMNGSLQAVVDQTYKLGGGFEEAQGISLALGQAWAKQKLQGEEILQMIERGVPVWELLEKVTGKNTAELQKLSEAGKLGRDTIQALMQEIGKQSAGAAADNMSLLSGLISNASDNLEKFYRMVAANGSLAWLKAQLADLNAEFNRMAADGSLQQWAKKISDGVVSAGEGIKGLVKLLYDWSSAIKFVGEAWLGLKIASWVGQIKAIYTQFISIPAATTAAASGIGTVGTASVITTGALKLLVAVIKTSLIAWTIEGAIQIGRLGFAIYDLIKAEAALRESQSLQAKTSKDLQATYAKLSAELGISITSMEQFDKLLAEGKIHFDEATGTYKKGAAALKDAAGDARDYGAEIANAAVKTKQLADQGLGDVFAKAGLDMDQLSGKVGKAVSEYVSGLDTMTKATSVSGAAIQGYLSKAFDSAKTVSELQAISDKMQVLHAQGKLVGAPYIDSMAQATAAAKRLSAESTEGAKLYIQALKAQKAAVEEAFKAGQISADVAREKVGQLNLELQKTEAAAAKNVLASNDLEDAYSQLGMKGAAALNELAAKQRAAFDMIQMSGAAISQQQQAFLAYAKAELEAAQANSRYADASLAARAASLGLSKELEALEKSTQSVGSQALITAGALDTMAGSASKAGDETSKAAKKQDELKSSSEGAAAAAGYITSYTNALQEQLRALSPQTEMLMKKNMGWTTSTNSASSAIDSLNQKLEANYAQWKRINDGIPMDDIQEHIKKLGLSYLEAERAYLKQAKSYQEMLNNLSDVDRISESTIRSAEHLYSSLDMLDAQDLSQLRSAIESAKQRLDSMRDSAQSALDSIKDDIDSMNNDLDAIEQRRYENQIETLKQKLAEAQAAGDGQSIRDYKEAIAAAKELHEMKMQQIAVENAAKAQSATNSTATASTSAPTTSNNTSPTNGIETRRFEIVMGNKSATVYADANNGAQLENLITRLQQEALRS